MTYFHPTRPHPLFVRTAAGGIVPVDGTPAYRDVTHIRETALSDTVTDGRTLEGIASPFNSETVIDSWWEGKFREVFRPGAFTRTISEDRQIMQFDHGMGRTPIGDMPIGAIRELKEVKEGLYVRAELRDDYDTQPLISSIRNGSITGMSIAFRVRDEKVTENDNDMDLREVLDVRLYELGPVTWPAYPATSVEVVSQVPDPNPDNMGSEEIAEGTGISSTTAKARLALARLHI